MDFGGQSRDRIQFAMYLRAAYALSTGVTGCFVAISLEDKRSVRIISDNV